MSIFNSNATFYFYPFKKNPCSSTRYFFHKYECVYHNIIVHSSFYARLYFQSGIFCVLF